MACNEYKNPLQRGGTDQQQRQLPALESGYVLIEERDFKEWIVFANQFAGYVKYYDNSNNVTNNWQPFFNSDISAILGTVAIQDVNEYRLTVKQKFDALRDPANKSKTDLLKTTLNSLFGGILTLTEALDSYTIKLPDDNPLKATITNLVKTKLQKPFAALLAYYKAAYNVTPASSLVKESDNSQWVILNRQVENPQLLLTAENLSAIWLNGSTSLGAYYATITADAKIYGKGTAAATKIIHASTHNLFTGIFDIYLQTYARIITEAESQLLLTLDSDNSHTPHYALFLSFLKLYKYAKESINTITQRHLDFYYKQVLQLVPKKATPAHAHITVELAKQVSEFMLPAGTGLKAGKDGLGKDVTFTLDADTVFNKAGVAKLMSIYRGDDSDKIGTVNNKGRWFASPVANSADGLGAKLTTDNGEWHPFYNKTFTDGTVSAINMPKAQVGFAVASHYLFLNEGKRVVNLFLEFTNTLLDLPANSVDCYITTAKGWFKIPDAQVTVSPQQVNTATKKCSLVQFNLTGNDPATANYNAALHGGTFKDAVPVVKVYLKNDDTAVFPYDDLKDYALQSVEVKVAVGDTTAFADNGLKQLFVSGGSGPFDVSKPFQPFGPAPKPNASFVIGNKEIFTKKGANIFLNYKWIDYPTDTTKLYYPTKFGWDIGHCSQLSNGQWIADPNIELFKDTVSSSVVNVGPLSINVDDLAVVNYEDDYNAYDSKSIQGFLKLTINADLGYDAYQQAQIAYLIGLSMPWYYSSGNPAPAQPWKPYSPTIDGIYISYTAVANYAIAENDETKFNDRSLQYYHLSPFGEAEQSKFLNPDDSVFMLPQFGHVEPDGTKEDDIAEFFVGLGNLQAQQSVNILFQVMDGTSDPQVDVYKKLITWNYLGGNQWKPFTDQQVVDGTAYLRQSGIISFQIPEDASTDNTIMPAGYLWLKGAISIPTDPAAPAGANRAGAVCKLLNVLAQAAQATFVDNNNDLAFLINAVPAGTISKMVVAQSSIKTIAQPYPSFGGKPVENDEHFYLRASERLRHKDRAITIWDYERLVLEAFPEIHRVKCLNHTKYASGVLYEDAPGYVTVITIPDLTNHNEINPLKPYTNAATLNQVQEYLEERISCHVNLNVNSPIFEEVQMVFNLKLMDGRDFSYYSKLLQDSITRFLSPWAYGQDDDVQFGGKVEKSVLINFIESQPYVDYITDVQLFLKTANPANEPGDQDEVVATTAISVLVSVPSEKHLITEIPDAAAGPNNTTCTDSYNMITI
ncbi:MAG TPA: baseplate J/gp47 family protein [Mucilaginibacter sp.]